jgi:hypothetical protein
MSAKVRLNYLSRKASGKLLPPEFSRVHAENSADIFTACKNGGGLQDVSIQSTVTDFARFRVLSTCTRCDCRDGSPALGVSSCLGIHSRDGRRIQTGPDHRMKTLFKNEDFILRMKTLF